MHDTLNQNNPSCWTDQPQFTLELLQSDFLRIPVVNFLQHKMSGCNDRFLSIAHGLSPQAVTDEKKLFCFFKLLFYT